MTDRICIVPNCGNAAGTQGSGLGYCVRHYKRFKRHGDPMAGRPYGTPSQRLQQMVIVGENPDDCWGWRGALHHTGYAHLKIEGQYIPAHRLSYELQNGPIPEGLHIDHLCRNRGCTNPQHLEAVTPRENILRGVGVSAENVLKTHCPQGHPYDAENTIVIPSRPNARYCRACHADMRKARRAHQRAAGLRVT